MSRAMESLTREAVCPNPLEEEEQSDTTEQVAEMVLPEEVWTIILNSVSEWEDLLSCSTTCKLFAEILRKWKTGWLLEQVLPFLYPHIPGGKITQCRLVCRNWNLGVERFFENHPSLRPNPHAGGSSPRNLTFVNPLIEKRLGGNRFHFEDNEYMPIHWGEMTYPSSWTRNPFLGRFVVLDITTLETHGVDEPLWNRVSTFLATFGKEIWYLVLLVQYAVNKRTQPDIRSNMQKVIWFLTSVLLQDAPNLRMLRIEGLPSTTWGQQLVIPPDLFPPAPQLETIEFRQTDSDYQIACPLVQRYHLQLRKLCLRMDCWLKLFHLGWPNLTELSLENARSINDFQSVCKSKLPKLVKLGLAFGYWRIKDFSFEGLVGIVRKISSDSCLSTMRLDGIYRIQRRQLETSTNSDMTPLVGLKTLEIDLYGWNDNIPRFNYLLHCFPLIENINMFVRNAPHIYGMTSPRGQVRLWSKAMCSQWASSLPTEKEEDKGELDIGKYIFEGGMYKSNIWKLLPRLKVFTFQWDIYTRQGYQDFVRRRGN